MRLDSIIVVARLRTSLFSTLLCRISLSRNYIILECSFFPPFVCFLALIERPLSFLRRAELAEAKKRAKTYKERKKHDRFDGMPEEEVSKRVLPDHLTNNLDIIIVSGLREGTFPLPFLLFFLFSLPCFPREKGRND